MFLGIHQLMMDRYLPDLPPLFNESESAGDGEERLVTESNEPKLIDSTSPTPLSIAEG